MKSSLFFVPVLIFYLNYVYSNGVYPLNQQIISNANEDNKNGESTLSKISFADSDAAQEILFNDFLEQIRKQLTSNIPEEEQIAWTILQELKTILESEITSPHITLGNSLFHINLGATNDEIRKKYLEETNKLIESANQITKITDSVQEMPLSTFLYDLMNSLNSNSKEIRMSAWEKLQELDNALQLDRSTAEISINDKHFNVYFGNKEDLERIEYTKITKNLIDSIKQKIMKVTDSSGNQFFFSNQES